MNTLYIILTPVVQFLTILAFLALIVLVMKTIAKMFPQTTARLKAKTAWMEWDYTDEEREDDFTNFVIHPSNYIKVPSSR